MTLHPLRTSWRPCRPDLLIALALCVVVCACVLVSTDHFVHLVDIRNGDRWFHADPAGYYPSWTDRLAVQHRSEVHPLMPLQYYVPVKLLRWALNLPPLMAVRLVVAALAALWTVAVFGMLRVSACRRPDALLVTVLAGVSSSALFMLPMPETYALGSTTMIVALATVAASRRPVPDWWYTAVSAATLSTTVTNWLAGLLMTFACRPWRRALQISVNALAIVVCLWGVQKQVFRLTEFFVGEAANVTGPLPSPDMGGPRRALNVLLFHSVVMPEIHVVPVYVHSEEPHFAIRQYLTVQRSMPGSAGLISVFAVGLWAALLLLGIVAIAADRDHRRFHAVLVALLAGQLILHCVFGGESFVYVLHVTPLLVALASRIFLTRVRRLAWLLMAILVVLLTVNNVAQLRVAVSALAAGP